MRTARWPPPREEAEEEVFAWLAGDGDSAPPGGEGDVVPLESDEPLEHWQQAAFRRVLTPREQAERLAYFDRRWREAMARTRKRP